MSTSTGARSRFAMPSEDVLRAREKLVLDHLHDVRAYYHDTRVAFPDQDRSGDRYRGRRWQRRDRKVRAVRDNTRETGDADRSAFFVFDADQHLASERVYFDTLTMLKQLLGAVNLRRPRNWLLVVKALRGLSAMSGTPDRRLLDTPPVDLS